jgi:LuxR family maltose regulon positive regulatory protein
MELRQADLCFTAEEAGEFFRQSIGVSISSEDINILTARAEGWITGLQMAAVSMRGCEDVSHFVQSFTGSNRYLLDYLMEEVFERQTEVIRDFLLKTSILNRLNGSLCNAVTGGTDGQSILETLDRANLFVVPLDETRFWYRYHNLFSELLRLRLQRTYPELAATLHQRASGWYERHGFTSEAIDQAISGGAYNRAGQLIEKTADSTLMHGRVRTFLNWMESLPDEVVCHLPLLSMYHAEALLFSGSSLDKVSKRLESASIYNAVQALSASYRGDIEHSKKLSERVLKDLPKEYVFLRGAITSSLGALFMLSGDVKPAIRSFRSAAEIGRESKNLMLEVIALSRMGQLYLTLGELQKAEEFLRKAVELSSTQPGTYLPIASMPMTHLAYLLLEKYELDSASSFIEKAVELSQESGGFWAVDSYVVSAFVSQAKGDFNGAIEAIGMARKVAYRTEANQIDDVYTAAYEAQLFAAQGNLPAALTWIRENHLNWQEEEGNGSVKNRVNPLLYHLLEVEQMTLAKICLAQGKSNEALGILVSIFSESEKRERRMSVMENLILQALAYQAQGDLSAALQKLAHVLSMASIEGYMRIFVDKGQPMKQLLKAAAEREINLAYVTALLELFRDAKTASAIRVLPCSLVEKLSMRELEILKLLAQRYSDKYIATTLVISRETVHKHLQNIYGKLGVHSRTEAVARAYELGILLAPLKE